MTASGRLSPMSIVKMFSPLKPPYFEPSRWVPAPIRDRFSPPPSLGKKGPLEVRLAQNAKELKEAQRLRYHIFYEEMSAIADSQTQMTRLDADQYDEICDHMLVVDHNSQVKPQPFAKARPEIVGTYRLLTQNTAEMHGGFYTAGEYDIQPLLDRHSDKTFMELGRSCVMKPYRTKKTVELLWHGIWSYVLMNNVDVMIGCASIEGTDPDLLADQLSFLHHFASAPPEWDVKALPDQYVEMNRIEKDRVDQKAALRALPPLVKGYLRLGAYIGSGAVIDNQFGTTDVLIILPVSALSDRYVNYYGADASRYAS
ncbi:GNAT family N-acetyltransferase [Rhodobacteraceae bacterium RKSG542]|uniref:GNAT family N-acetyltransferase n=1 Tax=Pseudovibrio flavus TaxID=2529854 RepID=UPI0012BB6770|nr:GNAT family N-acyltransferase [Pseudovibrio flavus]MTI18528.1 GNAT family N-acetyltransferase [Pseudovibrio flavus]